MFVALAPRRSRLVFFNNNDAFGTGAGAAPRLRFHSRGNIDLGYLDIAVLVERIQLRRNSGTARVADTRGLVDADFHGVFLDPLASPPCRRTLCLLSICPPADDVKQPLSVQTRPVQPTL